MFFWREQVASRILTVHSLSFLDFSRILQRVFKSVTPGMSINKQNALVFAYFEYFAVLISSFKRIAVGNGCKLPHSLSNNENGILT